MMRIRQLAAGIAAAALVAPVALATPVHAKPQTTERWVISPEDRAEIVTQERQLQSDMAKIQAAQQAAKPGKKKCVSHSDHDELTKYLHYSTGDYIYLRIVSFYDVCKKSSLKWAKISATLGYYNILNVDEVSCGATWPGAFNGVWYNTRYWDARGRNFNPKAFKVACSQDTINYATQFYGGSAPRLYYYDGEVVPRWRTTFKIDHVRASDDEGTFGVEILNGDND